MKEVSNPHDAIFKAILSRRDAAQSFLATYLPPALTAVLDVQSAELEKDSFVDEELRASYSDLVYSVNLKDGRSLCVYVLFEHKSEPEPLVAFHLIRYMVRLWEDSLKQGKRIRPIIPLVVYHGSASWSPAKRFHDLLDVPDELKPFVPDYRYILTDFSHMPDEEIGGNTLVRVFSVVLKYTFREDIGEKLVLITMTLRELMSWEDGMSLVATFLRYLAMSGARISWLGLYA